jgi:hypothetical protein
MRAVRWMQDWLAARGGDAPADVLVADAELPDCVAQSLRRDEFTARFD